MAFTMNFASILYQTACGAIAAAGFAVLFNVGFRMLPWCAASGAIALVVRACCVGLGMNLVGASFAAAVSVGTAAHLLARRTDMSQDVVDVAGCIAMVPGSFAAKAIIGLFALSTGAVANESDTLITATQYALRVFFITGAIGTGLAIPDLLLRIHTSR
jgi:uncharacterized membrane protein YjjB (DUF3815 family)